MKIEVIKEFYGVEVGSIKEVSDSIGAELIEQGLAKEVKEADKKAKK